MVESGLLEALAGALVSRRLRICRGAVADATGAVGEGQEEAPEQGETPEQDAAPPPKPPPKKKTWVSIELLDDEGKPLAGKKYRVKLPDGSVKEGTLDEAGKAKIEEIDPPGTCKVSFPEIDGNEWKKAR